jgi:hypothetical protein
VSDQTSWRKAVADLRVKREGVLLLQLVTLHGRREKRCERGERDECVIRRGVREKREKRKEMVDGMDCCQKTGRCSGARVIRYRM